MAWGSTLPAYAVVSVPNIPIAAPTKIKKGLFGSRKKNREAEEAAAEEAAARAAAAATSVQVGAGGLLPAAAKDWGEPSSAGWH